MRSLFACFSPVVVAAFGLCLAPALASAQLTVVSTEAHPATASTPATTDLGVDGDLAAATAMITASADAQLRAAAPQAYAPIDLALVRYHDTTTTIDSVSWRRAGASELGVTIRAHLDAASEHRTLSLEWVSDGTVRLADVVLEARVQGSFTAAGGIRLVVVGDSVSVTPGVAGLSALGQQGVSLNGRQLAERTLEQNPFADRHLRGTSVTITSVDATTAHARVTAVPTS